MENNIPLVCMHIKLGSSVSKFSIILFFSIVILLMVFSNICSLFASFTSSKFFSYNSFSKHFNSIILSEFFIIEVIKFFLKFSK